MPPKLMPAPTLSIKIGETPVDITMFFGRLHELAELAGGIERIPEFSFHGPTRTAVLDICLSPRDERGRRTDPEWSIPPALGVEDGEAVLDWASEHTLDFFLGQMEKHLTSIAGNAPRLTAVGASLSGSAGSAS